MAICTACHHGFHRYCHVHAEADEIIKGGSFQDEPCWCDCPGLAEARQNIIANANSVKA